MGVSHDLHAGPICRPEQLLDRDLARRRSRRGDAIQRHQAIGRRMAMRHHGMARASKECVRSDPARKPAFASANRDVPWQRKQHSGAEMGMIVSVDMCRLDTEQFTEAGELIGYAFLHERAKEWAVGDATATSASEVSYGMSLALPYRVGGPRVLELLGQVQVQANRQSARSCQLGGALAVAHVDHRGCAGDAPGLEALEDTVGCLLVAAEVIGVDDQQAVRSIVGFVQTAVASPKPHLKIAPTLSSSSKSRQCAA
jgi:hypothetical protein